MSAAVVFFSCASLAMESRTEKNHKHGKKDAAVVMVNDGRADFFIKF
jgi:hypothetical protein